MKESIGGVDINYEVFGAGKDVLILHGWGANIATVMPLVRMLEKNFRVWAIDFPGFGKSGTPPEDWDVYSYAEITRAFIERVHIQKPVLIGHSFGGRISIILSAKKMTDINKIILVDSAGVLPKRGLEYYIKVYSYKSMKLIAKAVGKISKELEDKLKTRFGSADYKSASPVMRGIFVRVVNEDLTYLMPSVAQPTLLLWGEKDNATPLSDAKIMEKRMPDAGLAVIQNAGHYSYLDNPAQCNIIINKFLENDR